MLTRETILKTLEDTLKPLDYVQAMWQGGAAAFNRVDAWSDIDLVVLAEDEHVVDVAAATENVECPPRRRSRCRRLKKCGCQCPQALDRGH